MCTLHASQSTCMNARMFPTLSKTSMSSSPNCTKPPVSLRRKVVCSFGLKIWDKQFYDQTKSHWNSYWWLQAKAKVKTHSLWFFHQVPEQGAVHLAPSLGAGAQDGLELLNTYFHVVVIVHHLGKTISHGNGWHTTWQENIPKATMHPSFWPKLLNLSADPNHLKLSTASTKQQRQRLTEIININYISISEIDLTSDVNIIISNINKTTRSTTQDYLHLIFWTNVTDLSLGFFKILSIFWLETCIRTFMYQQYAWIFGLVQTKM